MAGRDQGGPVVPLDPDSPARRDPADIHHDSLDAAVDCYATKFGPVIQARTPADADGRWPNLRADMVELFARHNSSGDTRVVFPPSISSSSARKPARRRGAGRVQPPGVDELPTASGMPVPYIIVYLRADRDVAEPEFADIDAAGGLAIGCRCVQRRAMTQRRAAAARTRAGRRRGLPWSPKALWGRGAD